MLAGLLAFALPAVLAAEPGDPRQDLLTVPELPRAAIERYARTDLEQWHYLRTRENEDGVLVDRHDPTLPGEAHWQLVSIDGREPTAEERNDYERKRADHSKAEEQARGEDVMRMVAPDSVQPLGQEGETRRFGYAMRSPDGKREHVYERLEGAFLVEAGATDPWVREVRVWNTDVLRPFIGVRIDEANVVFAFALQEGWVLPASIDAQWTGEFLAMKDISRKFRFTLSNFRQVETRPELAANP